ncbi:hypothetical protein AAZX31_08G178200 [Glycine max]|uniref:Uncharacterized protein n=2 Tax=Glycine subgen. Soja TaxID=1462606 RepID=A0A0R0INR2_SOYBN|nr:hypothetical protein JHK85_022161 [Glycine max]RZB97481.1 hypothetical protein D0Y65_020894 [Glycine soja]KAG5025807.1 hypothetical protein JHK86_021721 [Glycine max]KAG5136968.1 hypothetical protein JHK82_021699 [Glycine max]KAH1051806.1 hypothetical protein GYH30_021617 [Glycine max]
MLVIHSDSTFAAQGLHLPASRTLAQVLVLTLMERQQDIQLLIPQMPIPLKFHYHIIQKHHHNIKLNH